MVWLGLAAWYVVGVVLFIHVWRRTASIELRDLSLVAAYGLGGPLWLAHIAIRRLRPHLPSQYTVIFRQYT